MAISIPAILDTQIANLRAELEPVVDAATNTASSPRPPMVRSNRFADLVNLLCGLIDSGTLTATTGSETDGFTDSGAFTGVNSLVGATFTYAAATTTVALQGLSFTIQSNTVNKVTFTEAAPAANQAGDTGTIEFTSVDADIGSLLQGKSVGDSASNPYGPGPSIANLALKLLTQMGATVPSYLNTASGEPFGFLSPHGGGDGAHGHAGATLVGDVLQRIRDAIAAYTAPA
jgi:hypothetical protein